MGIMEILVKGDALVIFFAQVWQFRDPSTECGCPHDRVGERGRAPGNGYPSIRARTFGRHHLLGTTPVE